MAGTAASDTFNISSRICTVFGLDGDDVSNVTLSDASSLFLDGGAGNDSFTFGNSAAKDLVFGGDGGDAAFIGGGDQNSVSGGAGNNSLGLDGGASSTFNVLDGGDGDDFVGATANSTWLLGGTGNDVECKRWAPAMPSSAATATTNCRRMATTIR